MLFRPNFEYLGGVATSPSTARSSATRIGPSLSACVRRRDRRSRLLHRRQQPGHVRLFGGVGDRAARAPQGLTGLDARQAVVGIRVCTRGRPGAGGEGARAVAPLDRRRLPLLILPLVGFIVGLTRRSPPGRRHGRQDVRRAPRRHGVADRRARPHRAPRPPGPRRVGRPAARPDRRHDRLGSRGRPELGRMGQPHPPPTAAPPPRPRRPPVGRGGGTYIQWDPTQGAWMQWNEGTKAWIPHRGPSSRRSAAVEDGDRAETALEVVLEGPRGEVLDLGGGLRRRLVEGLAEPTRRGCR